MDPNQFVSAEIIIAVTKLYVSTRIRICCVFDGSYVSEFDTQMFESLIEHALDE